MENGGVRVQGEPEIARLPVSAGQEWAWQHHVGLFFVSGCPFWGSFTGENPPTLDAHTHPFCTKGHRLGPHANVAHVRERYSAFAVAS